MLFTTTKSIAIVLALFATGLCISTVILAVQKANLENELQDALNKLEAVSTTTTITTTTSTSAPTSVSSTSEGDPSLTTDGNGTTISSTTDGSTSTTTTQDPNYPTLPPGLPNPDNITWHLPKDIRAIKYRIYIYPDLVQRLCSGTVSIQFQAENVTNLIVLHAKDIEIENLSILNMVARMRIAIKKYYKDEKRELLIIELKEVLSTSKPYTLSIGYTCNLQSLTRLYASSYKSQAGDERWIATTKFEPTYARLAFPCFDEPALKAQFTITIARPTEGGYHALSNMNVESEEVVGNLTEVTFAESVPMSTYLISFIVSDFAHKSKTIKGILQGAKDFELRVFATPAQVDKVQYALDIAATITEYYIDYFNVTYPLPKLDMAAIPDFVSGAMENWGLVTYRESALLYDEQISSCVNKQRVATVVAHELAHMWFGNLVTMKWWNDLWLNEGFATFMQFKGVDKVHPDWDMSSQFLISELHGVMKLDATLASHPIVQTVDTPDQITELFDTITYSKGSSLVRMLEQLVGKQAFRNATTRYLRRHIYNTATTDDYLTTMEEENLDLDVKLIMQTWTVQMGLPVVNVTKDGHNYKLKQNRFLSNKDDYQKPHEESQFNYRWSIPITYTTSNNDSVQSVIFNYNDSELTITVPDDIKWIKFNKDQVGYYRVNYPGEMWQAFALALKTNPQTFSNSDRAHLINDAFSLADAAQLDYKYALDLSTYLEKEFDLVPWSVASSRLRAISNLLYFTDIYSDFVEYMRKILSNVIESIKFDMEGDDHLQKLLANIIINVACSAGHEATLGEVSTLFKNWLANPSVRPNTNIREPVYVYGMKQVGNETIWNQVWDLYKAEQDANEKIKLMQSLSAIREPWILRRLINLAWDEANVRSQDYFTCLVLVSSNRIGQSLVWDFVRENWPRLVKRFGINERYLGRMIPGITSSFATETKLDEMQSFFAKYPDAGAGTAARKQALETVKNNIKWLELNKGHVEDWLHKTNQQQKTTNYIS